MTGKGSDPELGSEDSRLVSLEERLDRAEAAAAKRTAANAGPESDANYRLGNRVLAELLGGLIGGGLFGWLIDRVAGTEPWGLLGMLCMGIVVAFRNIIRLTTTPGK
ncbi:AtpZ/AtpI family protein [Sphingopyxis sp. LK2115]|jgi:ATP synthase protein I|uniref:AtpZ/AtpI family protein n=1 Tax=Sphingopyxis sp. LK2115 TaxID=2744558 RepID=UPI001660E4A7|nr:AtpZ/AtpI family protein [Sphingopyxis sp. LK2115]